MNATEVKGSQGAGLVGGADATNQAVADAESAARAAAEAARKAAEAAVAAAAERNAQKARELAAQAQKLAEAAAKAAKTAANAAAKLEGALQRMEDRGKADPKLATAAQKATNAARAAKASATAASNSAAQATKARQQKPADRFEAMKDRKLELNPEPRPAPKPMGPVLGPPAPAQEKQWHPPMAPPTQPSPGFTSKPADFLKPQPPPKPLTPTERLELARERKLEQAERGGQPPSNPIPRDFSPGELAGAGQVERKQGLVKTFDQLSGQQEKAVGWYAFGGGVDMTFESQRSVKASPAKLQPGTGKHTVTFEVKQETKYEVSPGVTADNWLVQGRAGTKHAYAHEITYELTVPAQEAARFTDNPQGAPNPFDPRSLPIGGTMVVKMDDVHSTAIELEAARTLAALPPGPTSSLNDPPEKIGPPARPQLNRVVAGGRAEVGGAEITGRSVAIERVDKDTVRLMAGPSEGLKGAFSLTGFVTDDDSTVELTGKVEAERSFSSQTQRSVDLDLRNPEAQRVYAYFLEHGTLPPGGGSAAVASADVYQTTYKNGAKAELGGRYGQGSSSVSVNTEHSIDQKRTFNSDGTVDNEFAVNNGDRAVQISTSYDAAGNIDPAKSRSDYVVQGAAPEVAEGIRRSFTPPSAQQPPPVQGPQDLRIQLSQVEATELSGIAQRYVADWENSNNQTFNSATQPLIWALATAASPDEVATSLIQAGGRDEDYRGLTELAEFHQASTGQQLPGEVSMKPAR